MAPVQEALPGVPAVKEMALAPSGIDPMLAMMERLASNKDVDTDKLRALIEMQKDIMAVNATTAFNAAFALMQPKIPTIGEKGKTDKGTYAPREDIVDAVRPILAEHGFTLSFRTEWPEGGKVRVVGILTHEKGHSRESSFEAAADQSGSKNGIQAFGSSVEYGRRYTTTDLLNIVTRKADDDGRKAGQIEAPEGYQNWRDDIDAMVTGGCTWAELERAWKASSDAFRRYITKTEKHTVEAWKKKTTAVRS